MPCVLQTTVLLGVSILASGCAPWNNTKSAGYVTIEADTRHDTKQARQDYTVGRAMLDKHIQGCECDFAKAEKYLRDALAADVRFGPAHHSLGILYYWQHKLYLAAWEFEYAARLMPDRYEPLNNLGLVYEAAGKYEQAKSFYQLARVKSKNHPEVIANLARTSFRSSDSVDEMRPVLEDVLATDSRPEWRRWSGELLGLNPIDVAAPRSMTTPAASGSELLPSPIDEKTPIEELPLIPPPLPQTKPIADYFDETVILQ